MCTFLIPGSRVVARKSSRVVMPLPWSWISLEGQRRTQILSICKWGPLIESRDQAGCSHFVFAEWTVWKAGSYWVGTQRSKSILAAQPEQRKCFPPPPSHCQQPGLGSGFGVSLGSPGSLCHLSPAASCQAGSAGHLQLLAVALTDNPVGQPAGTGGVHPSFSFVLCMQRSISSCFWSLFSSLWSPFLPIILFQVEDFIPIRTFYL